MPSRRYLSVIDNYQIVIKTSNGSNGQKWFFDYAQRSITSRQNNQVIADVSNNYRTATFASLGNNQWKGNFKFVGAHIENVRGNCLDVNQAKDLEG